LAYGASQIIMFVVFGLLFYIGSLFIRDAGATTEDVFTAIYSIVFAAMTVGSNSHFMPDIGAAKNAAANLF
jgi:ATP-binding cassette subfamily B (MDR/TAP) protein 1